MTLDWFREVSSHFPPLRAPLATTPSPAPPQTHQTSHRRRHTKPPTMASMTLSASVAARAPAPNSASRSRHLASASSSSLRGGKAVAMAPARLSTASSTRRRTLTVTAAGLPPDMAGMLSAMDPDQRKKVEEAYAAAMKDPTTAKKVNAQMASMSGLMNNPMVAKQMEAMNNMIAVRGGAANVACVRRTRSCALPPNACRVPWGGGGTNEDTRQKKKTLTLKTLSSSAGTNPLFGWVQLLLSTADV